MKIKKELTPEEKIKKFINWLKNEKQSANGTASGGGSSWNWAYAEAMEKVYNKARKMFIEPKQKELEIIIDKSLEQYKDVPIFQEKLDKANEILEKAGVPKTKNKKSDRKPIDVRIHLGKKSFKGKI